MCTSGSRVGMHIMQQMDKDAVVQKMGEAIKNWRRGTDSERWTEML